MGNLTALEVSNFKIPGRLPDGEGLFLELTKTGTRRWLYRFRIDNKQKKYAIGIYPTVTLSQARQLHQDAKFLVKQGKNPITARQDEKRANIAKEKEAQLKKTQEEEAILTHSFEAIALEWYEQKKDKWSKGHAQSIIATLRSDAFPHIGLQQIETITTLDIKKVLNEVENRGALEMASKLLQRMRSIFSYAVQTGRLTHNPTQELQGTLKSRKATPMPAAEKEHELAQLLKDITANTKIHLTTKLALQFTALTACRSGEVRNAIWDEFDLQNQEWHIPAERMKMKRPHIVPLSTQAHAILQRSQRLWGKTGYVFPSVRDQNKPMSDNAMSKALRDMGYKGKATPHGFRSSFSTMAYESGKFLGEVIEKSLAHEEPNKVKRAYNRAQYLSQRRELLQWWGEKVQKLTNDT